MVQLTDCKSSNIAAHGYDAASRTLAVRFTNGKVYHYRDVPPETAEAMAGAESIGRFFGSSIRGKFDVVPIVEEPQS